MMSDPKLRVYVCTRDQHTSEADAIFSFYVTTTTSFRMVRRQAARMVLHWGYNPEELKLVDGHGSIWPDSRKVAAEYHANGALLSHARCCRAHKLNAANPDLMHMHAVIHT